MLVIGLFMNAKNATFRTIVFSSNRQWHLAFRVECIATSLYNTTDIRSYLSRIDFIDDLYYA